MVLLSQLKGRVDFREHNSSGVTILNGQSHTISRFTPRTFARSIQPTPSAHPGYQTQVGEGPRWVLSFDQPSDFGSTVGAWRQSSSAKLI